MAEIWFIRHGQSLANAGQVTEGTDSVPLTDLGHQQALAVSTLITTAPDLIVVTPYLRTQQTAVPTLAKFPDVPLEVWNLQEFASLSPANYATPFQFASLMKDYWNRQDPDYIDGEGAESFNMLLERMKDNLVKLHTAPENFIIIFTHGHIMHTLRVILEFPDLNPQEMMGAIRDNYHRAGIDNCATIKTIADQNGLRLQEQNNSPLSIASPPPKKAVLPPKKSYPF